MRPARPCPSMVPKHVLGDMRKVFLQIAVRAADDRHSLGRSLLEFPHHIDLPGHVDQRIVRRLVAVRRRICRGALDVRIVVRRTGGKVEQLHTKLSAEIHELQRLGEIILDWILRVHPESIFIGQAARKFSGIPGPSLPGCERAGQAGMERNQTRSGARQCRSCFRWRGCRR